MPKKTINDYIFYKIACDDCPDYIYIGSTSNFRERKCNHKSYCNNPNAKNHNLKLYQVIREYGGWANWNMIIIDKAEQLTLIDARIKEEQLRKDYNANLNSLRAYTSDEERKDYNKTLNKKKTTCICGCEMTKTNISRHIKTDKHINLMKLQNQEN